MPGDLASTPTGRAWVIKALHPSDPISEVRGLPDATSCPTVVMSYYNVYRVGPPAAAVNSWGFDLTITPDVVHHAGISRLDDAGAFADASSFVNQSLNLGTTPVGYADSFTAFRGLGIEAHRLLSFGVTAYQDGPALSNQGTLTAAQWEAHPTRFHCSSEDLTSGDLYANPPVVCYQYDDQAEYSRSQHLPNAYFGESKDGCYVPLRLSDHERWRDQRDLTFISSACTAPTSHWIRNSAAALAGEPPFADIGRVYRSTADTRVKGTLRYEPLSSLFAGISVRNLSVATSFAFYFRVAVECRVTPSSVLAPQAQMSPPYDPLALASYYRINRELKDGYPADFNDLGKLWDVIKSAATVAGKALSVVPGVPGLIGTAIPGVVGVVDHFVQRGKKKKVKGSAPRDPPPAASVQRARMSVQAKLAGRKKK